MINFKNKNKSKLNTRIVDGSLASVPWEEAYKIYENAASLALADYRDAREEHYKEQFRQEDSRRRLLAASLAPEGGGFEGDVNLEYSPPAMTTEEVREVRQKAGDEALLEYFIKPYQLKSFGMRVMEEILAIYKNHRLNNLGAEGTICGKQYLLDNFDPKDKHALGIYRFLQFNQRSAWLSGPATKEGKKFCNLVPLILFAHKLYNDVPYNRWGRENIHYVVNSQLATAMLAEHPELSVERRLQLRDIGLTAKGEKRSAQTTYMLYGLKGTEVEKLDSLSKAMILQTWCAHPTNRTKYMILDSADWDKMPSALLNAEIFKSAESFKPLEPQKPALDIPWFL